MNFKKAVLHGTMRSVKNWLQQGDLMNLLDTKMKTKSGKTFVGFTKGGSLWVLRIMNNDSSLNTYPNIPLSLSAQASLKPLFSSPPSSCYNFNLIKDCEDIDCNEKPEHAEVFRLTTGSYSHMVFFFISKWGGERHVGRMQAQGGMRSPRCPYKFYFIL